MTEIVEAGGVLKLGNSVPQGSIFFHTNEQNYQDEPLLKLEKGFFWYRGEKIQDIKNVYERFNEFLSTAEKIKIKE